ncbi:MAG: protein kinase [Polyangiaceae bacterium]
MPGLDPSLLQLLPGAVIGDRYEVVRRIKQGGMGAVYEVLDRQTNRRRGLKMLLPSVALDAVSRERFRREATVSGRVESDHIVETIDAGTDQKTRADYLVMELLRGEDLGAELARRGRIPAVEVLAYLSQVAAGLHKVHAEGIAHRDLKLENIFVTRRDDGSPHLKLLDFGVAKVFEAATGPLQTTQVVGTPLYMAPEQLTGDALIDHRADLYSLGHLTFAMLVGHAYWEPELRDSATIYRFMSQVMAGAVESATTRASLYGVQLSTEFDAWFSKATARDANDRFQSAITMLLALAEAFGLEPPPVLVNRVDAPATDPFGATTALPGGDSTTGVVGPRAKTTHSRARVVTAAIVLVILAGGVALWRVAASSATATRSLETDSAGRTPASQPGVESSRAASAQIARVTTAQSTQAPASGDKAAETAPEPSADPAAPMKPPSREPAPPRSSPAKPSGSLAIPQGPVAKPKPAPAPASGTAKPKGGYDPLDEL